MCAGWLAAAGGVWSQYPRSDAVLSVCPPHAALPVARMVAASGFAGVYVDANAVAATDLEAVNLGDDATAASALKMCYGAWTKGTGALLLTIRAAAAAYGVQEALVTEGFARAAAELYRRLAPGKELPDDPPLYDPPLYKDRALRWPGQPPRSVSSTGCRSG
jgi:hypothetical protein